MELDALTIGIGFLDEKDSNSKPPNGLTFLPTALGKKTLPCY